MKFSIVVAFKNRDQKRVQFFLDSLKWQTENDFQLIFINQGSDDNVTTWLELLLPNYHFVKYIHNFTQGYLFNKSNALNIGINAAEGKYIVIADIDIVFPPDYFKKISDHLIQGSFITHKAYYLPETFQLKDVESLFLADFSSGCIEKFIGLCVATKESFLNINGYDEYFLTWGGEDDDIINRLELDGGKRIQFSADSMNIYHQWHIGNTPAYPTPWYLDIVNYIYFENKSQKLRNDKFGIPIKSSDRSILEKLTNPDSFKRLELIPDPLFQFTFFIDRFSKMNAGEFGQFEFPLQIPPLKGRKQKVIDRLNLLLAKCRFPYRLEKTHLVLPINTRESWRDFVTYFIGKNRGFLIDYYLIDTEEKQVLYFQKK